VTGAAVLWRATPSSSTPSAIRRGPIAKARSACTCETCGAEGRRYVNHGWLATACPKHAVGDPAPKRPGLENIHLVRRTPGTSEIYHARCDRETDTLTEVTWPDTGPEG
jgi:hypothetical protein